MINNLHAHNISFMCFFPVKSDMLCAVQLDFMRCTVQMEIKHAFVCMDCLLVLLGAAAESLAKD